MTSRLLDIAIAFTFTFTFIASTAQAEDWPGWLGPRRDGSSTEIVAPWKGDLKIAWKAAVKEGHSSPIVVGDKVFLHASGGAETELISAFDAKTGDLAWKADLERGKFTSMFGNGPRGTPCVVEGKLYAFGITGILTCSNAKDGAKLWQVDTLKKFDAKNLFFGASCSPLVDDGRVYVMVGGKGAGVVAFDKDSGKPIWQALDDKASYSSPILIEQDGKKRLVVLTAANLVALDPKTGAKVWEYAFKDLLFESSTTPVRAGDVLFGSSITLGSVGLKLKGDAVEKAWMEPGLTCYFSTPVVVGKDLYLVTSTKPPAVKTSATLRCIDADTGKERWKREGVGKYHASLTRTGDGKLLLIEEKGDLVLIEPDPKEYRELARAKICGTTWAHPAVAGGRLYIRDNRELVCVELQKK